MDDIPLGALFVALLALVAMSAFFSGSETGLMAVNRYRLRHRANKGDVDAMRVSKLLERPDRLLGIILLGNTFVNVMASAIATIIAISLLGDAGLALAPVIVTLVLLIFGEATPKTLAALHPDRVAYPASVILAPLLKVFYPVVWLGNAITNGILKLLRVTSIDTAYSHALSHDELRTVVMETGLMVPKRHQTMLLSILDLGEVTVEDIMVPRNQIKGIDLEDPWRDIVDQLIRCPYSRLVVYRNSIDQVVGLLHLREVVSLMFGKADFGHKDLQTLIHEPYFIPEGTPLHIQLWNFQQQNRRTGLVVDEYGDIMGLVTVQDILEEIVGEFTTDPMALTKNIVSQDDGSFLVDGSVPIRTLNRTLNWTLPTDGPKTVNGLVMEYLEAIPEPGAHLMLGDYPVEIVKTAGNRVKTLLMRPPAVPAEPE